LRNYDFAQKAGLPANNAGRVHAGIQPSATIAVPFFGGFFLDFRPVCI
jgi:hypothetical protein